MGASRSQELSDLSSDESEIGLTTDAAVNSFPNPENVLKLCNLRDIEKQLDDYELVSLVYLLYENSNIALQELEVWLNGSPKNLLYDWATNEDLLGVQWQKKLIEALCIIRNYEILKTLGYVKADLNSHYLPHQPQTAIAVNRTKKAIYCMFEKLSNSKSELMLNHVRSEFGKMGLEFKEYEVKFMEMYFLYWETNGYIKPTDLTNLAKILKVLPNFESIYDIIAEIVPVTKPTSPKVDRTEKMLMAYHIEASKRKVSNSNDCQNVDEMNSDVGSSVFADTSKSFNMGQDNANKIVYTSDDRYHIDPNNPGVCLIINQENFYVEFDPKYKHLLPKDTTHKLEARTGTEVDKKQLENTFKKFGFTVTVLNNLTHYEIVEEITRLVEKVRNESSLFVCILSHGDRDIVYGVNSCKVQVTEIQNIMCKTNKECLLEKPKVLILQSCQGTHCQNLDESDEEPNEEYTTDGPSKYGLPATANIYTFWATVPGYAAIRNKRSGTWFIQSLCEKMIENGNKYHFADICTRIVKDVTSKVWRKTHNNFAMTPMIVTTLTKDLYLPPLKC